MEELMRGRGILIITILGWALAIALALVIVNREWLSAAPQASQPLLRPEAEAAVVTKPGQRTVYFPGTEELAQDEMRIVACGTGNPVPRLKQAAACFLVQLGNGDNFVFDMGSGSAERLASLDVPYDKLDKVFIGHLHLDHVGDLPSFYFTRAVNQGRSKLRVWGPSGVKPEWGMKAAMENMKAMYGWESAMRGALMGTPELEVNEFDWTGINQIIYNENGVIVRSIPALHGDQSVSFILEWNGLRVAYSSDTMPNKWWCEHTKGVDVAIHEAFYPVEGLIANAHFTPLEALNVGTRVHTPPQGFGKVMDITRPRLAIAYHLPTDISALFMIRDGIREYYDGPLDLADDFMVWNVTKESIRNRMAVPNPWHVMQASELPKIPGDPDSYTTTELTRSGVEPAYLPVVMKIYRDFNSKYGTDYKPGSAAEK
jgi:ribonuclease Z